MRLVNFKRDRTVRVGAEDGGEIVDLIDALGGDRRAAAADRAILGDTISLIAAGPKGMRLARKAVRLSRKGDKGRMPRSKAKLTAPLQPSIILCSGENYWDHREEKPKVDPKEPEFFVKVPQAVCGPRDTILYDRSITKKLDYEAELAVLIGKPGRHIPKKRALEHVFGYTIMNDVTARDRQVMFKPDGSMFYIVGPSKNFDTSAPMGPCIVTADEMRDPQTMEISSRVNKEVRQHNTTANMIWKVADLVAFFSANLTLKAGMVISTGTPGGTAWGTDPELGGRAKKRGDVVLPAGYLRPGDVVTCEIEGIGKLRNKVAVYKRAA